MDENKGLIFDIQSFSVHDGPGCRTSVFFMGCPLRCNWCANPEGWEMRRRLMYRATKCTHAAAGCRRCIAVCARQALSSSDESPARLMIDWKQCKTCESFECVQACLKEALVVCGQWYSVPDLMKIFSRDRHYWSGSGGVTFTGGDPLFQRDFLLSSLKRCREAYIHTAIETSACFPEENFMAVLEWVDFAFIDIKHMNAEKHKQQTGVSNDLTLQNIAVLADSGWKGRAIVRIPVIPGFNDDDENIVATAEFVSQLGLKEINILPFHRLGDSKWRQCGLTYPYSGQEAPTQEKMDHIRQLVAARGLACHVGSDTPF